MKTPISYYGGKQKLAATIIQLLPEHKLYCEPFFGGGAVFFQKPKSYVEVINDVNKEMINFYKIVQTDFVSLEKEVQITLHSRDLHRKALTIYKNPDMFSELKRAWAVWTLAAHSFSSIIDGSFGYDIAKPTTSKKIANKREGFTLEYAIRLQEVQIECTDAIRIIKSRDNADALFYCDPPYYNSDCGHYDGYTIEDFEMLLATLSKIEGKFLLSSYPSEILKKYKKEHGWYQVEIEQKVSVANKSNKPPKTKIEVLTSNYPIKLNDTAK
jgi:DNA adenine methylase